MFEIFNDSGLVQVDSTNSSLVFVGRFSMSIQVGTSRLQTGIYANCAIAVGDTQGFFVAMSYDAATAEIIIDATRETPGSAQIQVLLFARNAQMSEKSNYGLRVYNQAGQICYNSEYRPLTIFGELYFTSALGLEKAHSELQSVAFGTYLFQPMNSGVYTWRIEMLADGSFWAYIGKDAWRVGAGMIERGFLMVERIPVPYDKPSPNVRVLLVDGSRY